MAVTFPAFQPPVSSLLYPHLCITFVSLGFLFLGWFFTLQVAAGKSSVNTKDSSEDTGLFGAIKRMVSELVVAFVASLLLGFGLLFVCLNVGIYV